MRSSTSWWVTKVRQFGAHLRAGVGPAERRELASWLSPAQLLLFDSMHPADRRHGLDVVATLRGQGVDDPDILLAGLLHDAGKGRTGIWPRVAWSLGEAYGPWVWRLARPLPGFGRALDRLRDHASASADLAAAAGCSARTIALIRARPAPGDAAAGELLRLADEAN